MFKKLADNRDQGSLAALYEEKVFGLTKSFVAYGGWGE